MDPTTFRLLMCAADDDIPPPAPSFPGSYFANQTDASFTSSGQFNWLFIGETTDGSNDVFASGLWNNGSTVSSAIARIQSDGTIVWMKRYAYTTGGGSSVYIQFPFQCVLTGHLIFSVVNFTRQQQGGSFKSALVAVNASTGNVIWQTVLAPQGGVTPGVPASNSPPTYIRGLVQDSFGNIYAAGLCKFVSGVIPITYYDGFVAKVNPATGAIVSSTVWRENPQAGDPTSGSSITYFSYFMDLRVGDDDTLYAVQEMGVVQSGVVKRKGVRTIKFNQSCLPLWQSTAIGPPPSLLGSAYPTYYAGCVAPSDDCVITIVKTDSNNNAITPNFSAMVAIKYNRSTGAIAWTKQILQTGTRSGEMAKTPQGIAYDNSGNFWFVAQELPGNTAYYGVASPTIYKFNKNATVDYCNVLLPIQFSPSVITTTFGEYTNQSNAPLFAGVNSIPQQFWPWHRVIKLSEDEQHFYLTGYIGIADVRQPLGGVASYSEALLAKLPSDGTAADNEWVTAGATQYGRNTFNYVQINTGVTMPDWTSFQTIPTNTTYTDTSLIAVNQLPRDSLITTPVNITPYGFVQELVPTVITPINPADILVEFDPAASFASQAIGNIQAYGIIQSFSSTTPPGISGSVTPYGSLRFGREIDPVRPGTYVYTSMVVYDDPPTAGAIRSETAFDSALYGIPQAQKFYHAFAVFTGDWRTTTDAQLLMQWNAGGTASLQPIYSMDVTSGALRLVLRYNNSLTPSVGTTTDLILMTSPSGWWKNNTYLTVVTEAVVSIDPLDNPYIKTWINGQLVVDYTGPIGYVDNPTYQTPYAKHGVYHWQVGNPWDMSQPARVAHYRRAVIVNNGTYTPDDLSAYVNTP
jgi:hypothetical protein